MNDESTGCSISIEFLYGKRLKGFKESTIRYKKKKGLYTVIVVNVGIGSETGRHRQNVL